MRVSERVQQILNHLPDFGCSEIIKIDFWVGGGNPVLIQQFAQMMAEDGYNTTGAWEENKAWFDRYGISQEEYQTLCDESQ